MATGIYNTANSDADYVDYGPHPGSREKVGRHLAATYALIETRFVACSNDLCSRLLFT